MEISWDDRKEVLNLNKPGISFDEAATVILNPLSIFRLSKHRSGKRFEYIGHSDRRRVLYVVTIEKDDEQARILSAREATPNEKKEYEQGMDIGRRSLQRS